MKTYSVGSILQKVLYNHYTVSEMKKMKKIHAAMLVVPLLSTVGSVIMLKRIQGTHARCQEERIEKRCAILIVVAAVFGLGFILFIINNLILLGKKLQKSCD